MSSPFLTELIARYQAIAVNYLRGRLGDSEAAQDLYQTVVGAVVESRKSFASLDHLRNYFFVALRNAAVDFERGKQRSRQVRLAEAAALADGKGARPDEELIAREELLRRRRRLARLERLVRGLPAGEQQLLRQRFWERRTFRDIQEATGVPISTLKSREDAILRRLKKRIGKEDGGT